MASSIDVLHIECEERDERYLQGGNFFGTEDVGPPPLEPLPEEALPLAGYSGGPGVSGGASGGASSLMIKLPGKMSKTPPAT